MITFNKGKDPEPNHSSLPYTIGNYTSIHQSLNVFRYNFVYKENTENGAHREYSAHRKYKEWGTHTKLIYHGIEPESLFQKELTPL